MQTNEYLDPLGFGRKTRVCALCEKDAKKLVDYDDMMVCPKCAGEMYETDMGVMIHHRRNKK